MPYSNQLIDRVRKDIAYSQARNARISNIGQALGSGGTSLTLPSSAYSLPSGMTRTALGPTFKGQGGNMLTTIKTPWGPSVTVDAGKASRFNALMQGLKKLGYNPQSVQGYNYRNIAGTNTLSKHALGLAIDIDPQANKGARLGGGGTRYGYFDPAKVVPLVKSLGMSWGGLWKSPDPMHFSFGEG